MSKREQKCLVFLIVGTLAGASVCVYIGFSGNEPWGWERIGTLMMGLFCFTTGAQFIGMLRRGTRTGALPRTTDRDELQASPGPPSCCFPGTRNRSDTVGGNSMDEGDHLGDKH